MRIKAPQEPFELTFRGPDGPYILRYRPVDEWDGQIRMVIRGIELGGQVLSVEQEPDGRAFMGATDNFRELYQDEFWFELRPDAKPATIEYFGDRVLWRKDVSS